MLAATAPAAAAQNGYADPDMDSITVNQLGNELDSLSMITRESVQTAQQNTQQIERVVRGFITLYTSLNEHMSKDVSQLEETIGEENMN